MDVTLPVKKKQHISRFSATMANANFLFLGETPRNKPGRQNRLHEIPQCFSVKFLGEQSRFRGVPCRDLKNKYMYNNFEQM